MQTRECFEFKTITGAYSRFGFHHPGPINFYYWSLWIRAKQYLPGVFPSTDQLTIHVAQLCLNSLFLVLTMAGLYKIHPWIPILFMTSFWLINHDKSVANLLIETWNPAIMFMTTCFISSISLFGSGHKKWLLPAAIAGTFMIQNHLGSSGFTILCTIAGFIFFIFKMPANKNATFTIKKDRLLKNRGILLITGLFLFITFLPFIYDLSINKENSNPVKIIQYMGRTKSNTSVSQAFNLFLHFFIPSSKLFQKNCVKYLWFFLLVLFLIFFLIFIKKNIRNNKKSNKYKPSLLILHLILFLALGASFFSALSIRGKPWPHIMLYMHGLAALFIATGITDILIFFFSNGPVDQRLYPTKKTGLIITISAGLFLFLQWNSLIKIHLDPEISEISNRSEKILEWIKPQKDTIYSIYLYQGRYCSAGVAYNLIKKGIKVFAGRWDNRYPQSLRPEPDEMYRPNQKTKHLIFRAKEPDDYNQKSQNLLVIDHLAIESFNAGHNSKNIFNYKDILKKKFKSIKNLAVKDDIMKVKYYLDTIQETKQELKIGGWAFPVQDSCFNQKVVLLLEPLNGSLKKSPLLFNAFTNLRPDVAAAFNNHKLTNSGFYCIIPKTAIPKKFFGLPLNLSLIVLSDNPLNKITKIGIADSIRDVVIKEDCQ